MDIKLKSYSDPKRWQCIYPAYIDSKKTASEGRRIKRDKAVECPTAQEIFDIIDNIGLKCELEKNKMYVRDGLKDPNLQGRVRVQIRNDDGTPVNAQYSTRTTLLLYVADMIPKLKSRQTGGQEQQGGSGTGGGKQKKKK